MAFQFHTCFLSKFRLDGSNDTTVLPDPAGEKPLTAAGGSYAASVRKIDGGSGTPPPPLTSQGTPPGKPLNHVPSTWGTQSYANVLRPKDLHGPTRPQTIDDVLKEDLGYNYAGNVMYTPTDQQKHTPFFTPLSLLLLLLN